MTVLSSIDSIVPVKDASAKLIVFVDDVVLPQAVNVVAVIIAVITAIVVIFLLYIKVDLQFLLISSLHL